MNLRKFSKMTFLISTAQHNSIDNRVKMLSAVVRRSSFNALRAVRRVPMPLTRSFAAPPAIAENEVSTAVGKENKEKVAAVDPTPIESNPPKPAGSLWQRFTAFLTGVGVASCWYFYSISADVWESTDEIHRSIETFREDVTVTNQELRQRIAQLEHELAALKK